MLNLEQIQTRQHFDYKKSHLDKNYFVLTPTFMNNIS